MFIDQDICGCQSSVSAEHVLWHVMLAPQHDYDITILGNIWNYPSNE